MLFETDILLAALNPSDSLNAAARRVIAEDGLLLSPFSLLELNLLARAGKLDIPDLTVFAKDLTSLLEARAVRTLSDRPEYHSEARHLELEFGLTFFDSLHGAVSKVQREIIVSFDRTYDKLVDEGVKRLDPRDISGRSLS